MFFDFIDQNIEKPFVFVKFLNDERTFQSIVNLVSHQKVLKKLQMIQFVLKQLNYTKKVDFF